MDTDFSKFAREFAIKRVTELYGSDRVAGIMTKNTMGALNALTYAPKLYAFAQGKDTQFYNGIGAQLRSYARQANNLSDIEELIKQDFSGNKDALTIFEYAKMMEGLIVSFGQHAAGVINIMDNQLADFIPLMAPVDNTDGGSKFAIQADMIAAEAVLGFIKFDFLGLKNLNVITKCLNDIEAHYGVKIDPYSMEFTDPKAIEMFADGLTNFVFQFESDGMKGMLRQLKPTCFEDLILAVSVYRPGPMDFIPGIINAKNNGAVSEFLQLAPDLKPILEETYGYPVYQEQVMKITQVIGGFTLGEADNVRRAMSKKQEKDLQKQYPKFIEGAKKNGYTEETAAAIWEKLIPFAKYGFNKSHAAAYSVISYITAYLKCYYPEEYLCAAMTEQGDKIAQFVKDCKTFKIDILPPDINQSMSDFSSDKKGEVRFGFSAIKGLKEAGIQIEEEREKNGPFKSLVDVLERLNLKSNNYEALCLAGVFDCFTSNRVSTFEFIKNYIEARSEVTRCENQLEDIASQLIETESDAKSQQKKLKEWNTKLLNANAALENVVNEFFDGYATSNADKVMYEVKYLGTWVSISPLDEYEIPQSQYISAAIENYNNFDPNSEEAKKAGQKEPLGTVTGVVTEYKEFTTKDGKPMAGFKLIDKDGDSIDCVVFNSYFDGEKGCCKTVLENHAILTVTGNMAERNDEVQIKVTNCKRTKNLVQELLIHAAPDRMGQLYARLEPYKTESNGIDISVEHPDIFQDQIKGIGQYTEEAIDVIKEMDEIEIIQ